MVRTSTITSKTSVKAEMTPYEVTVISSEMAHKQLFIANNGPNRDILVFALLVLILVLNYFIKRLWFQFRSLENITLLFWFPIFKDFWVPE